MTEKQFEQLKSLLEKQSSDYDKQALDIKVLQEAQRHTEHVSSKVATGEQRQPPTNVWQRIRAVFSYLQMNSQLAAVSLSVVITGAMLFGLQYWVSVPEKPYLTTQNIGLKNVSQTLTKKEPIVLPEFDLDKEQIAQQVMVESTWYTQLREANQLKQIEVPNVTTLIADMDFALPDQRKVAQQLISQAMVDIREMLHGGQWREAEIRYANLKQSCDVCDTLPASLESLLAVYKKVSTDSG